MARRSSRHRYHPAMGRSWLTPLYDPLTRLLGTPAVHRELVRQAAIVAQQRVLEIGCGTGSLAIAVKRGHPDADVVALDPDPPALRVARRKSARKRLDIGWDEGFAQELPYPDDSFDRVLSALMLHHLDSESARAALREAHRVLAPGGSLHVVDLDQSSARFHGRGSTTGHSPGLAARGSQEVVADLSDAGFEDVTVVGHRALRFIGRVAFYRAVVA